MFVMEPGLWIVTIVVLSIGIAFLWRDLKVDGNRTEPGGNDGSEN